MEPRDQQWAAQAEENLRAFVEKKPRNFTVRPIECRSSLCAFEVASLEGTCEDLGWRDELKYKLESVSSEFSYESQLGARVTITFRIFQRM